MGWNKPDVYHQPEAFGIELFGEVELSEPCYSFDIFAIFRDKATGRFGWAQDYGCSCPSPFEDHTSMVDVIWVDKPEDIATALEEELKGYRSEEERNNARLEFIPIYARMVNDA